MAALFSRLKTFHDPTAILVALPVSLVIVVGSILSLRTHSLLRRDRDLLLHSYQVVQASDRLLLCLSNAETAQRGFLITGDRNYLDPYTSAITSGIPAQLQVLHNLLGDNVSQEQRVSEVSDLASSKTREMATSLSLYQDQGFNAARDYVRSVGGGKALMDRTRQIISAINSSEADLVLRRSAQVHNDEQRIIAVAVLTTAFSTVLRIGIALWRRKRPV